MASPGRCTIESASGARAVVDVAANSVVSWLPRPKGPDLVHHREDAAPDQWPGGSPLLFPAVGRNVAENQPPGSDGCTYAAGTELRRIGIHGFSMSVPWRLYRHSGDTATVEISEDDLDADQRASYPYAFRVRTEHRVGEDGSLQSLTTVQNCGDTPLPFSLGNHITLRFPFTGDGSWADGHVRAPLGKRLELDQRSLLSGARTELSECASDGLPLDSPSTCDAVLGGWLGDERWVELRQRNGPAVRMSQEVKGGEAADVEAANAGMHVVLWGSREEGFFCPEPWVGAPNSLNTGVGRVMLAPDRSFTWQVIASASFPEEA